MITLRLLPHEPRPGTIYVKKSVIALARNGAGFIGKIGKTSLAFTPDPRQAVHFDDRAEFLGAAMANPQIFKSADYKLIACSLEIRVGPKAQPPDAPAPLEMTRRPKRKRKTGELDGAAP